MSLTSPTKPPTMRAAVLHEIGAPLVIEEIARPVAGADEVLVKVLACGVCHSDLHAVDGDWLPLPNLPLIPGHEVVGTVVERGPNVAGLEVGDVVGVPWMFSACQECQHCLAGQETVCLQMESTGYTRPGGYAEYLVAPAAFVVALPSDVDPVAMAPILCAGLTTYRALQRARVEKGDWVAVVGVGGLGHLAVQWAVALGQRVVAVDVSEDSLTHAGSVGAEVLVNSRYADPIEAVHKVTGGGVHGALVCSAATVAFEQATAMLRPSGTVVFVGMPGGEGDLMQLPISSVVIGEISVRGSSVGTRADLRATVDLALQGAARAATHTVQLADINDVLAQLRSGSIVGRAVIVFDQ
jgi:alcohol dehydrogenase, propanol-preferring